MTIVGVGRDYISISVVAKDIYRTSACACEQLVERFMTIANAPWNNFII